MVLISEELIRKRAEHNESEISTLEEISLHQLDIERIEYIDKWCRELKILYLQSNLIPKLENLSRLKKLEYLNLALNNIELIENLEGCESLQKLDLTVNFIGNIISIERLQKNTFLKELYLTGNPCTDFIGYRDYVIAALKQLTHLDGKEVNKSERILAVQNFSSLRCEMLRQQQNYLKKIEKERKIKSENDDQSEEADADFWSKPTPYTPESRLETHQFIEKERKEKEAEKSKFSPMDPPKREIRYFNNDGYPLNINQAQLVFCVDDDEENGVFKLDLSCYKHLDTSLIDVDIQPIYVRVKMKEKVFQLVLNEEISPDQCSAQRSQTTGHLVLTLPKLQAVLDGTWNQGIKKIVKSVPKSVDKVCYQNPVPEETNKRIEKLEIGCNNTTSVDIYNIVQKDEKNSLNKRILYSGKRRNHMKTPVTLDHIEINSDFIDDSDVPPLE